MILPYNSLVVDASYINKFYEQSSIIGKGRDLYLGISSINYLMSHKTEGGRFILQIYENLSFDLFRQKVLQLQKVMIECVNDTNTRIILLGEKELNDKKSDLYVLYRLNELKNTLDKAEALNPEQAEELLITFCKNYLINGRTANEFLDIAPQNIFLTEDSSKYVISNMGISYKGSKFHRPYTVVTDNFFKEKNQTNICHTYAFQAALVILCAITKINSSDFFFNDGQLKDGLLQQVLQAFKEKLSDDQKKKLKNQFPSLARIEKPFEGDFKKILHILSQMLSLDEKKRSIINVVISYPENLLQLPNPFFLQPPDVEQEYIGFGSLEGEQVKPEGYGCGKFKDDWHYGTFQDGKLEGEGTIEIRGKKSILYILLNIDEKHPKTIAELNNYIYFGEFDEKLYVPNGNGILLSVLVAQKQLPKKKQILYFSGEFEKGLKKSGQQFYKSKADFDGDFQNGEPKDGVLTYGPNHIFAGLLKGLKRISGKLFFGDQIFEGEFENDKPKAGVLLYPNGNEYKGLFQNGQRQSLEGQYTFCNGKLQYIGNFRDDALHGKGTLTLLETKEQIEVEYEKGILKTDLPQNFKDIIKQSKEKQKDQQPKKQDKNLDGSKVQHQDDDGEQIPEDLQEGYGDDDGQQNYDMDDEEG